MMRPDQLAAAGEALLDQAEALLKRHEREAHGGGVCHGNRGNLIAWLAHRLGVNGELWDYAGLRLAEYQADCPHCNQGGGDAGRHT